MSTPAASKPKIGNITRFFIPGLALGLLIGAIGGAYYAPAVEQTLEAPSAPAKPAVRNKPAPESRPESGATGESLAAPTGAPK